MLDNQGYSSKLVDVTTCHNSLTTILTYFLLQDTSVGLVDLLKLTIQATTECTPSHFTYSCVQTIVLIGNTSIV